MSSAGLLSPVTFPMEKPLNNIGKDSLVRTSINLSWPLLITYFLQLTVSLADIKMVGLLGTQFIAAIGIAHQLLLFVFLMFIAFSAGASIYLSQYVGKKDFSKVKEIVSLVIMLSLSIGLAITFAALVFSKTYVNLMSVESNVARLAETYIRMVFVFSPVLLLNYMLNSIMISTGDSKTPLYIMILINILNIVFSYLLIFGVWMFPKMGIAGCALGTGLSRATGMIIGLFVLYRRGLFLKAAKLSDLFKTHFFALRFDSIKKIFSLGLPVALQEMLWNLSMIVVYKVLSAVPMSTEAISAFTVALNVESLCIIPGMAFMQAATVLVAQCLGAGETDKAQKTAWTNAFIGSLFMALIGFVLIIFSSEIMTLFSKDPPVVKIGKTYLTFMGFTQFFVGIKFVLTGALKGAGDTKTPFYIEVLEYWAFRIPLIVCLVFFLGRGTTSVWIVMAISNILGSVATVMIFRKGQWKKIKLV